MTATLIILPLALLALGFPIFIVLLLSATAAMVLVFELPLAALHQVMFGGVDKFALLAVPFFIYAGELMNRGGISDRLVAWVLAAAGHLRGSLGLTAIGTATVLGAISGSSPATVAASGRILHPALLDKGYGRRFASGVITSSGSIAIVIPPSIAMILYGAAAEQSIPKLFLAGVLPGLLIAGLGALYAVHYAVRHDIRESRRFDWRRFVAKTRSGAGALAMPVIILGGIYSGWFSPTEAAGIACIVAILLTRFAYREMSWRDILSAAADAALLTAQIMIIVAAAGAFSWLLTVGLIPQKLIMFLTDAEMPAWAFLLVTNLLLLVLGCVIDPLSAILVLTPLLAPIASALGIDLIHFGIIMTVNLSIGMSTPPFGLNIFVANSLFEKDIRIIFTGLLPFIGLQIVGLALVTYVPGLSLLLANLL